ncbi:MAG TPA: lipid kinase [Cellvibrio sp.]
MTVPAKALLLINPHSRNGSDTDIQEGIELLRNAGTEVIVKNIDESNTAAQLIEELHNDIQLVIVGGGDGTINSALSALYRFKLRLGILPLGTANDLARSLGIPTDIDDAFKIIYENNYCKTNLGVVNGKYFFNVAHIGLGVKVTEELTPDLKKRWGVFSYLKAIFAAFKNQKKFYLTIKTGEQHHRLRSIQLAVGSGRYYGGGNIIDEDSEIDDGLLRLYSLYPLTFWQLLTCAPLLRFGKHKQIRKTFTLFGKEIEIITAPPLEIHADGEHISQTPAVFKVIPQALEVICAADNDA